MQVNKANNDLHCGDTGGNLYPRFTTRSMDTSLINNYKSPLETWQRIIWTGVLLLCLALPMLSMQAQDDATEPITVTDASGEEVVIEDTSRILTIDGSVTEIVFALGAGDQVIGRDDSSLYPPVVNELESVGYVRRLSAEPVLALDPSLIITSESAGPPEVVEQLKEAGVTILIVPTEASVEGVVQMIEVIATALSLEEEGEVLIAEIEADYAEAQVVLETIETTPRVMFIYARGAGAVSVAGTNTSAATMIELAGGENAVTEFEGYQPITAESVVTAAPDVILLMTAGLESLGGVEGLVEQPGIAQTPAAENGRIVAMEDLYLLGFSTRTGTAVLDLTYLLHEELEPSLMTLLRADGRFNTLLRGIEIAGQETILSTGGMTLTIFAPTDEAFAEAFTPEVLEGFFSSAISVQATLSYHALDGVYLADDLVAADGESLQTLYPDGQLTVSVVDDAVTLNEGVTVVEYDNVASNGVLHVIDTVLVPARP